MILSPISEIDFIGRNGPYLYSFILFVVVSIVLAVVDNFPAIVALRFIQGLAGSPALASGAASIQDMYDVYAASYGYALCAWRPAPLFCLSDSAFPDMLTRSQGSALCIAGRLSDR
jgi:MFS transporter, DHA1 family, multidrug resistance protein